MTTQNEPGKSANRDQSMKRDDGKRNAEQKASGPGQKRESETRERAFAKDDGQAKQQAKPMSTAERNRRDPLIDTPDNAARGNRPGVDRPTGAPAERIARERAANPKFDDAGRADDRQASDRQADDTRKAADIQSGARNRES